MTQPDLQPVSIQSGFPRIVFMGTPEFAVASLDALLASGLNIVGVITAPDKPAGRGMKMNQSAVKAYATGKGLKIMTPEKLKNSVFLDELRLLQADLQVVVAFRMLPEVVWTMPSLGTINLHGSLLPQYRGAAPINWAVINGEKKTGVTTFKLQHEIDTGNILLQESMEIGDNENAGQVHDRMKIVGAGLLVKTVKGIAEGSLREVPQETIEQTGIPGAGIRHAPKLFTENCQIDWRKTAEEIFNLIRGLSPHPAAFTSLDHKTLKIYKAEKQKTGVALPPGTVDTDKKSYLRYACADGYINLLEIQLEGKKKMTAGEFLRGYRWV